jgi:hypothetical protein
MILIGVLCAIVPAMLMPVVVEKIPKLSLLLLVVAMFGIVLIITMTKEYINDYKKSKNAKNQ